MKTIRIEFWWAMERMARAIWHRFSRDRASYWFDWAPAFTYRRRKAAERS